MNGDELIARHQIVRAFVEKEFPNRRVTEIVEEAKTTYIRQAKPPHEYVLMGAKCTFHVDAVPDDTTEPGVQCRVVMLDDGTLRIYDTCFVLGGHF